MKLKGYLAVIIMALAFSSAGGAQEYTLQYFLGKANTKDTALSKAERTELLNQIERLLERTQRIRIKLIQAIQTGELDIRYQEGIFWTSKFEEDRGSIETALQQIKALRDNPALLVSSVRLYKLLKDLSANFNACNNIPLFSAQVGDLAPEIELWADPVFYELHLLSLARAREKEPESKPAHKEEDDASQGEVVATKDKEAMKSDEYPRDRSLTSFVARQPEPLRIDEIAAHLSGARNDRLGKGFRRLYRIWVEPAGQLYKPEPAR